MKHKTWFRLVLKAIGVLFFGIAIPSLIGSLAIVVNFATQSMGVGIEAFLWQMMYGVGAAAQMIFGLYLFFRGEWIVNKAIPSNKPYCPECGYDISSTQAARCPECGVGLPDRVN